MSPPAAAPNGSVYVSRAPNRVLPADRSNGATIWEFDGSAHGHKPLSLQYSHCTQREELLWLNSISSGTDATGVDIQRSLIGSGRYFGGLKTRMKTLASTTGYTKLYYLDVIPWYVRAYVHTVKVTLDGATIVDGAWHSSAPTAQKALQGFTFAPSKARSAPATVSAELTLTPGQVVVISLQFELAFLNSKSFHLMPIEDLIYLGPLYKSRGVLMEAQLRQESTRQA